MTFRRRKATHHVSDPPMANFFYSALPKIFSLAYLTLLIVELALVEVTICPSVVTPQAAVTHAFAPSPTHLVTEFRHSEEVSSHVAPNDMHVMGMPVLDHNKDPIRFPRVEAEADLGRNVGSPPARPNYQPESSFRKFKNRIKALLQRFKEESIRSYESAKGKIHLPMVGNMVGQPMSPPHHPSRQTKQSAHQATARTVATRAIPPSLPPPVIVQAPVGDPLQAPVHRALHLGLPQEL
ncbi:hypothetical protein H4Q26_009932 [Puccinia striiformis f. sp. tritici PST-130]|nr:hypothetical protein H4Q26_009932 [Puccinia striiformis f. sp. tritici PST-130]